MQMFNFKGGWNSRDWLEPIKSFSICHMTCLSWRQRQLLRSVTQYCFSVQNRFKNRAGTTASYVFARILCFYPLYMNSIYGHARLDSFWMLWTTWITTISYRRSGSVAGHVVVTWRPRGAQNCVLWLAELETLHAHWSALKRDRHVTYSCAPIGSFRAIERSRGSKFSCQLFASVV